MAILRPLISPILFLALACGSPDSGAETPAIAAGAGHAVALDRDGRVLTWGDDGSGQLGLGRQILATTPQAVVGLHAGSGGGPQTLAAGFGHNLVLRDDGSVWAWGANKWYGELGDGGGPDRATPLPVGGLGSMAAVAASNRHSVALGTDGSVWCWGSNSRGQLGDGTDNGKSAPIRVAGLPRTTAIAAGAEHTLAVSADGGAWAWGNNDEGQLGDGSRTTRFSPVRVAGLGEVADVAAGTSHSLALGSDGSLWAWGGNDFGQLGNGSVSSSNTPVRVSGLDGVVAIAAGGYLSLAVTSNGGLWVWGSNVEGGLGRGTQDYDPHATPLLVPGTGATKRVLAVALGEEHVVALTAGGEVWTWGNNAYGRLGDGTTEDRFTPAPVPGLSGMVAVTAGWYHTLALGADGSLRAWGGNGSGQLGNGTPATRATPISVAGLARSTAVSAGWSHTLALGADGRVRAWGLNESGQLGDDTTADRSSPVQVQGLDQAQAVAAGFEYSLAIRSDGSLWGWGANFFGQLGDGSAEDRHVPVPVAGLGSVVAAAGGGNHSLAVRSDGSLWSWGGNEVGQLGIGSTTATRVPTRVPGLSNMRAVAAGWDHSLALDAGGRVWTWGANDNGQLGDGTSGEGNHRTTPYRVPGLENVVAVAAGYLHSLARTSDGSLWAWGNNWYGQLGDETDHPSPTRVRGLDQVATAGGGFYQTFGLKNDGTLWAWGNNNEGQLGTGVYKSSTSPQLVINEPVTGILDLDPIAANVIPPEAVPRVILAANKEGGPRSLALGARVYVGSTDLGQDSTPQARAKAAGGGYNIYVGAWVPAGTIAPPGIYLLPANRQWVYYTGGALPEYLANVALAEASHVDVSILDGMDISGFPNTEILVGWGRDGDEMVAAGRYRVIYRVPETDTPAP